MPRTREAIASALKWALDPYVILLGIALALAALNQSCEPWEPP